MCREAEIIVRDQIYPARQPHLTKQACLAQLGQRRRKLLLEFLPRVHA
jgi:hypothetical protein